MVSSQQDSFLLKDELKAPLSKSQPLYYEGDGWGGELYSILKPEAGLGCVRHPPLPSLSRDMWKMKILSCVNLEAKLKNPVTEQGPSPEKAVSLTPGDGMLCPVAPPHPGMASVLGQAPLFWGTSPPASGTLTVTSEVFRLKPQQHGVGAGSRQPKFTSGPLLPKPSFPPLSSDAWQNRRKSPSGNI